MGQLTPVDPPALLPPRLGLLASSTVLEGQDTPSSDRGDPDERWPEGLTWTDEPSRVAEAGAFDPQCGMDPSFSADSIPAAAEAVAFGVWAAFTCSTHSRSDERLRQRADRAVRAHTQRQVEAELWNGTIAQAGSYDTAYFTKAAASGGPTVISASAPPPIEALAAIEAWTGDQVTGQSVIHARRDVVTYWQSANLLRREGNLLLTALDTIVVPGEGYGYAGPAGETAGTAAVPWVVVTRPLVIRLGPITIVSNFVGDQRAANDAEFLATRDALYEFDTAGFGALRVTLGSTTDPSS